MAPALRLAFLCSVTPSWLCQAVVETRDWESTQAPPSEDLHWKTAGSDRRSQEPPARPARAARAASERLLANQTSSYEGDSPWSSRNASKPRKKTYLIENPQSWADADFNLREHERQERQMRLDAADEFSPLDGDASYDSETGGGSSIYSERYAADMASQQERWAAGVEALGGDVSDLDLRQRDQFTDEHEDTGDGESDLFLRQQSRSREPSQNLSNATLSSRHRTMPGAKDIEADDAKSGEQASEAGLHPQSAHSFAFADSEQGDDLVHRDLTDVDPLTAEVKVLLPLAVTHSTAEIMLQLTDVPRWSDEQPFFLASGDDPSLLLAPLRYDRIALSAGKAARINFAGLSADTQYMVRLNWSLKAPAFPQGWSFRTKPRMEEL